MFNITSHYENTIKSTMSFHHIPPFMEVHIFVLHSYCIFFLQIEKKLSSKSIGTILPTALFFN